MLMFVTGVSNIRDVIPFARTPGSAEFWCWVRSEPPVRAPPLPAPCLSKSSRHSGRLPQAGSLCSPAEEIRSQQVARRVN